MGDAPKSSYEIAMEKLKRLDRERGEEGPTVLTNAQKKAIGEIRKKFEARMAEAEILHKSERAKALENPETTAESLQTIEEGYARERRRIEEQREAEIKAVRSGKK